MCNKGHKYWRLSPRGLLLLLALGEAQVLHYDRDFQNKMPEGRGLSQRTLRMFRMADLLRQSVAKCWNVETELCKCLFCGCNSPCFIVVVLSVGREANMWSWTAEVPGLPSGSSVLKSSHVTVLVWTYQSVVCFPPALSWLHMYNNACL